MAFLSYLEKQWAGDLLYSWSLTGRKNAVSALGIPLSRLPTTNNHLEGTNKYLKNNQLQRFQRKGYLLRADVLYIALVSEIIPNILALRSLAADFEKEKAERRKDYNIMDQSTGQVLEREYPQVAYLSQSSCRDESARRLLGMKKVAGYKEEKATGKLLVRVESESTPQLMYMYITCVHGQATDIGCQYLHFLQTGVLCKHIRAAALYIEELRKQENHRHLPEMVFATRQEARMIRRQLHASSATSATEGSETGGEEANSDSDEDMEDDEGIFERQENISQNDDTDSNISEHTSSQEILSDM